MGVGGKDSKRMRSSSPTPGWGGGAVGTPVKAAGTESLSRTHQAAEKSSLPGPGTGVKRRDRDPPQCGNADRADPGGPSRRICRRGEVGAPHTWAWGGGCRQTHRAAPSVAAGTGRHREVCPGLRGKLAAIYPHGGTYYTAAGCIVRALH